MNQTEFAAVGSMSRATQVNFETDRRSPDANYLSAVAGLGVDVQYVVLGIRATNAGTASDHAAGRLGSARAIAKEIEELARRLMSTLA